MVICDMIWRDPATGKRTLLGCFSAIHASEFPAIHPMVSVHTAITNGHGKVLVELRLVDASTDELIWGSEPSELELSDPRMVGECDFIIGGITFPLPGEYRFQLFVGSELIMERRLVAMQLPEQKNEQCD